MALQNFVDYITKATASWLNKIDVLFVTVFGEAQTKVTARTALFSDLTPAANKLPYFDSSTTMAFTDLSSFGRSLIDDAAATNARTTLGLVIGTDVQAYDAELAALAGLTSAADKLPYFTGSGTASLADLSTFGRSLIDDAAASDARTTLGLGSIATQAASSVAITGGTITGITDLVVADGGTGASSFTDAGVLLGNGAGAIQVTTAGTSGQVLTSNGAGVDPTFQTLSTGVTSGTSQATTSGTAFDFTGLTGAKHILVVFNGVSLSGTDNILVQLGDAGGIEATGYVSSSWGDGFIQTSTAGFIVQNQSATNTLSGHMYLSLVNAASFLWTSSHSTKTSTTVGQAGGGDKSLSEALTQLRITRSGTDTFDAGTVNVLYWT